MFLMLYPTMLHPSENCIVRGKRIVLVASLLGPLVAHIFSPFPSRETRYFLPVNFQAANSTIKS